jgi:hypothetical protein
VYLTIKEANIENMTQIVVSKLWKKCFKQSNIQASFFFCLSKRWLEKYPTKQNTANNQKALSICCSSIGKASVLSAFVTQFDKIATLYWESFSLIAHSPFTIVLLEIRILEGPEWYWKLSCSRRCTMLKPAEQQNDFCRAWLASPKWLE